MQPEEQQNAPRLNFCPVGQLFLFFSLTADRRRRRRKGQFDFRRAGSFFGQASGGEQSDRKLSYFSASGFPDSSSGRNGFVEFPHLRALLFFYRQVGGNRRAAEP